MVLRNLILVINPIIRGIRGKGNHLGSLSAAPDPSEGQEQGGWGVRVQGHLQVVKYIINTFVRIESLRRWISLPI